MNIRASKINPFLVYLLPIIHLCLCAEAWTTRSLQFMLLIDAPMSGFFLAFAWRFGHPVLWFVLFGTPWWYLLSLGIRKLVQIAMGRWYET